MKHTQSQPQRMARGWHWLLGRRSAPVPIGGGTAPKRSNRLRIAALASFALLALAVGLGSWTVWDARREARKEADRTLTNLARTLGQDMNRNIELYATAIQDAVDGMRLPGLLTLEADLRQAVLFSSLLRASYMRPVMVLDEAGNLRFESGSPVPRPANFADRHFFQVHRDRADAGLYIGRPSLEPTGPLINISRRMNHSDGSFAGVVVGAIHVSYFQDLLARLDLGAHGAATLIREDGVVLARIPYDNAAIGRDLSRGPTFKAMVRVGGDGVSEGRSIIDGVERLYAFHRVGDLPLTLAISFGKDDAFSAWRNKAAGMAAALLLMMGLAGVLALALRRELSGRTKLERRLREGELQFRLLAENASDMVLRVGPDGAGTYVSSASTAIFGVDPAALVKEGLLERAFPEDRTEIEQSMQRLLDGAAESATATFRLHHPRRGVVWAEAFARAVRKPDTNEPDGYVSIVRDITARRAAQDALTASETRFRLLADTTNDAITCLDLSFRRTYASPAFRTLLGYEPDELVGQRPASIIHSDDADQLYRMMRRLAGGEIERGLATYRVRHKDGRWLWMEESMSLARNEATNQPATVVCVARDVSERKLQEDELRAANAELERMTRHLVRARALAERASGAKSRFLAGMSHELRTPLNGILGYAQLLRQDGNLNPTQFARVAAMLDAGTHLLQMINGVLDLSQIEAEQFSLQNSETDLHEIAHACVDLVRPIADGKRLRIGIATAPGTPRTLIIDPTRLRQILLNLLGNAVKFTEQGTIELRLLRAADGTAVRIEVADRGPGIPASQRSRLFQDFERLGAEGSALEGAGLGLALSNRLASLMNGTLEYEDNPGGGSIFRLTLPITLDRRKAAVPDATPPVATSGGPECQVAYRVLVVDDVAMNRDIANAFLQAAGHTVTCVQGGAEAVAAVAEADFDAVLMDVRMPEVDGLEATRRIRALAGPRSRVPIVALTAQAFEEQIKLCVDAGMVDHLLKPFTQNALLAVLTRAVLAGKTGSRPDAGLPGHTASQGDRRAKQGNPAPNAADIGGEAETVCAPAAETIELPTFSLEVFESTASFLSPASITSYLSNLSERSLALLESLNVDTLVRSDTDLAASAHTLAGSAGMFGFERLAAVMRDFEFEVVAGGRNPQGAARAAAAIEATLPEIGRRIPSVLP